MEAFIKLCHEEDCTGCGACANSCSQNAIRFELNRQGETIPRIDHQSCIRCRKCISVCPVLNEVELCSPIQCYAAHRKNLREYPGSAAGGIAGLLMEEAVKSGWAVYGSTWDDSLQPVFRKVETPEAVEKFRGSRYVQTQTGEIYKDVENNLSQGNTVLFVGMPCQVAGLRLFLRTCYERLYCVDIFCHGVVPASYLAEELKYLGLAENVDSMTFRGYESEEDYTFTAWKDGHVVFREAESDNYYVKAFLKSVSLRNSCYQCPYAGIDRAGDISVGDFRGLKNPQEFTERPGNINAILINTEKGKSLFKLLDDKIVVKEREVSEAQSGGQALQHPAIRPKERARFLAFVPEYGFSKAIRSCMK